MPYEVQKDNIKYVFRTSGFLERARASSESWVVCDTRYPSMEASLS